MKTYRLTLLDELHLEKKRLREERAISEQRLSYQFQYLQDNWGTMLTKGVLSSVKHKFAETVDTITSGSSSSSLPFRKNRTNPLLGIALNNLPQIGGLVWKVAKPTLMTFALKRVSRMIFGRRRRK